MSWLSWITKTPKLIDTAATVVERGVAGIDALFFTQEEKAQMSHKTFELWLEVQRVIKDESSVRSVTRRVLAVMCMAVYLGLIVAACVVAFWEPTYANFVFTVAKELTFMITGIAFFYFGTYGVGNYLMNKEKKE